MEYGQRILTVITILLAIAMLCGGLGFLSYTYGQNEGYESGYKAGQETSYNKGYSEGNGQGYEVGYENGYQSGLKETDFDGYNLRDPSYQDMQSFLDQDTIDSKVYIKDKYVCSDYAAEVNNNAEAKGIRCALVTISYPEGYGHTIVAFETTDRGLILIEPQYDDEVKLVLDRSYSQLNGYDSPPGDDTIQRFRIIW